MSVVTINYSREKRMLCNKIKNCALNNGGILFGGVVRDDIIGKHYRNEFIKRNMDFSNYWDPEYDIETKHRLIIPNDVDVYFKAENNSNTFINRLREFIKEFGGKINIIEDANFTRMNYSPANSFLKHKIITLSLRLGRTLFHNGISLTFRIDLIEYKDNRNTRTHSDYYFNRESIEPPFNNLDFLCNSFIMEKSTSGNEIVRLSNCTGTPIDDMLASEKILYSASIISDIINFRTKFTRNIDSYNSEYINCFRILKMINRSIPWNITNLPFREINITDIKDKIEDKCCICLDENELEDESTIIEVNTFKTKSNYIHKGCFIQYLTKEQQQKYVNPETNKIVCRCPFRGIFNFGECYREIKY